MYMSIVNMNQNIYIYHVINAWTHILDQNLEYLSLILDETSWAPHVTCLVLW